MTMGVSVDQGAHRQPARSQAMRGSWGSGHSVAPQSQGTGMDRFDLLVHLQAMHVGFDFKNCHRFLGLWQIISLVYIYALNKQGFLFLSLFEILHKI